MISATKWGSNMVICLIARNVRGFCQYGSAALASVLVHWRSRTRFQPFIPISAACEMPENMGFRAVHDRRSPVPKHPLPAAVAVLSERGRAFVEVQQSTKPRSTVDWGVP